MSIHDHSEDLETQLSKLLTEGEMEAEEEAQGARRRLLYKHEIRALTDKDPIIEETEKYRSMAEEVDDRYDRYMKQSAKDKKE
jgi:hypothetical protein